MRVQEKGNTDVVRLLVRTVSIPPQQQSSTQLPPASRSGDDGDIEQLLLEATSAGDVLQEEESRWLVVSDTFYPGDIRRYDTQSCLSGRGDSVAMPWSYIGRCDALCHIQQCW